MLNYQLFPRSVTISNELESVINCFEKIYDSISSDSNEKKSNEVLRLLSPRLESLGYEVEKGKSDSDKINVPVLFGINNNVDKCFYADALSKDGKIVIEIEAGRATENNQFLKDIFQASMMYNVEYLVLAVRNRYRTHFDFERVYAFLETMYISNRIQLPLRGIMLIGY
ncbi:MAG: hypothetical protein K6E85_04115 [Lachnospiraceae bacterium]|nr:hypothetical protein [Lachnospiraceae bacterium]